jgi:hypothetical protein
MSLINPPSKKGSKMDNLVTKVTKIIPRNDGSEVKIVAQAYFGAGLHCSVGADVFRRESPGHNWKLCSDKPHPDWRKMSVSEYVNIGRSEMLQAASQGEILAVVSAIGKPMNPALHRPR